MSFCGFSIAGMIPLDWRCEEGWDDDLDERVVQLPRLGAGLEAAEHHHLQRNHGADLQRRAGLRRGILHRSAGGTGRLVDEERGYSMVYHGILLGNISDIDWLMIHDLDE